MFVLWFHAEVRWTEGTFYQELQTSRKEKQEPDLKQDNSSFFDQKAEWWFYSFWNSIPKIQSKLMTNEW